MGSISNCARNLVAGRTVEHIGLGTVVGTKALGCNGYISAGGESRDISVSCLVACGADIAFAEVGKGRFQGIGLDADDRSSHSTVPIIFSIGVVKIMAGAAILLIRCSVRRCYFRACYEFHKSLAGVATGTTAAVTISGMTTGCVAGNVILGTSANQLLARVVANLTTLIDI